MTTLLFKPAEIPTISVQGEPARFPVHRIYCVGRNYEEHAREMGTDPKREAPFFFTKPADAVIESGAIVPYPSRTGNFHHEIELVIAIGVPGANIPVEKALEHVYGYAVGIDLTRRDLQLEAREKGRPWDTGKAFDRSAAIGAIRPAGRGHISKGRIWLAVNGELRQDADVAQMIWNVPEIISELSTFFDISAGDLIYTGTPAGIGPIKAGDRVDGGVAGLEDLCVRIV